MLCLLYRTLPGALNICTCKKLLSAILQFAFTVSELSAVSYSRNESTVFTKQLKKNKKSYAALKNLI